MPHHHPPIPEIESESALLAHLDMHGGLKEVALQGLDLEPVKDKIDPSRIEGCFFLGCHLPKDWGPLPEGNYILPPLKDFPFHGFPNKLYNSDTLYTDFDLHDPASYLNTPDKKIYDHFVATGMAEAEDIRVTLGRRLHDHGITDALYEFIAAYKPERRVAIMGGHSLPRTHENYRDAALIGKKMTEGDYLVLSGGGPGAMEATHLGAWLAGYEDAVLDEAISILAEAPTYDSFKGWLRTSFEVINRFPLRDEKYKSLGIPTWFYGHEPPTPFATHIAKYFANSVREEGLLAIAKGGIVYCPGNAGTMQEIFQDAAQNHYQSFGKSSPMVFLNKIYWTENRPVYPMLEQMVREGKYRNLALHLTDEAAEAIRLLKSKAI